MHLSLRVGAAASLARALRVIRVCVELRSTVITKTTPPLSPSAFALVLLTCFTFLLQPCQLAIKFQTVKFVISIGDVTAIPFLFGFQIC